MEERVNKRKIKIKRGTFRDGQCGHRGRATDHKTFTVFCLVQTPCVCQDEKRFT
jgi:hypothetical protein